MGAVEPAAHDRPHRLLEPLGQKRGPSLEIPDEAGPLLANLEEGEAPDDHEHRQTDGGDEPISDSHRRCPRGAHGNTGTYLCGKRNTRFTAKFSVRPGPTTTPGIDIRQPAR